MDFGFQPSDETFQVYVHFRLDGGSQSRRLAKYIYMYMYMYILDEKIYTKEKGVKKQLQTDTNLKSIWKISSRVYMGCIYSCHH